MAVLPVEVTDRFRRLHPPTANKTKNPMLCHCHIATLRLPPDWLLPSRTVLTRLDLVPCLSLLVTYTFVWVLIFSAAGHSCVQNTLCFPKWQRRIPLSERIGHAWKQGAMVRLCYEFGMTMSSTWKEQRRKWNPQSRFANLLIKKPKPVLSANAYFCDLDSAAIICKSKARAVLMDFSFRPQGTET